MPQNNLTIGLNINPFTRGVSLIKSSFRDLGKTKISMGIDKKTLDYLDLLKKPVSGSKKFSDNFDLDRYKKMNTALQKTRAMLEEIKRIESAQQPLNLQDTKRLKTKEKLLFLEQKHTAELNKQHRIYQGGNLLQRKGVEWQASGAKRGGMLGKAEDMIGSVMGGAGSALSAMGPAGWAMGMGIGAYGVARALSSPRRQMATSNLQFQGLNRGKVSGAAMENIQGAGIDMGYGPQEMMQSALSLQRNVGNVDYTSAQDFARTKRTTGLGDEDLSAIVSSFREAASTPMEADLGSNIKKTQELYAQAMVSALDSSGAIRFMETTASMTSSIANEGTPDIRAIQDTLSSLALSDDFYKANAKRSEAALKGAEGFFKSGEGTGTAMLAMQASDKFKGASPGEMILAQRMGFTQKDFTAGKYEYKSLGAEGVSNTVEAFLGQMGIDKESYEKTGKNERAFAGSAMAAKMNISPESAMKLMDIVMTGKKASDKEINALMQSEESKQKDKTDNLLGGIDRDILKNEALLQKIFMDIGAGILPLMTSMEGGVLEIADHLLGRTREKTVTQLREEQKKASKSTMDLFVGGPGSAPSLVENVRESEYVKAGKEVEKATMKEIEPAMNILKSNRRGKELTEEDRAEITSAQWKVQQQITDTRKDIRQKQASLEGASPLQAKEINKDLKAENDFINRLSSVFKMLEEIVNSKNKVSTIDKITGRP